MADSPSASPQGIPGEDREAAPSPHRDSVSCTVPDLMHATQVAQPFHMKGGCMVRLISRNGRYHTKRFVQGPWVACRLASNSSREMFPCGPAFFRGGECL